MLASDYTIEEGRLQKEGRVPYFYQRFLEVLAYVLFTDPAKAAAAELGALERADASAKTVLPDEDEIAYRFRLEKEALRKALMLDTADPLLNEIEMKRRLERILMHRVWGERRMWSMLRSDFEKMGWDPLSPKAWSLYSGATTAVVSQWEGPLGAECKNYVGRKGWSAFPDRPCLEKLVDNSDGYTHGPEHSVENFHFSPDSEAWVNLDNKGTTEDKGLTGPNGNDVERWEAYRTQKTCPRRKERIPGFHYDKLLEANLDEGYTEALWETLIKENREKFYSYVNGKKDLGGVVTAWDTHHVGEVGEEDTRRQTLREFSLWQENRPEAAPLLERNVVGADEDEHHAPQWNILRREWRENEERAKACKAGERSFRHEGKFRPYPLLSAREDEYAQSLAMKENELGSKEERLARMPFFRDKAIENVSGCVRWHVGYALLGENLGEVKNDWPQSEYYFSHFNLDFT